LDKDFLSLKLSDKKDNQLKLYWKLELREN
jgi:hypothetical protein